MKRNEQKRERERIPLGCPTAPRPEIGPTVRRYYEKKHASGCFGSFYPLHIIEMFDRENR